MNRLTELVYIGDSFYWESGTAMSSVYKVFNGQYERYDWGFVQRDLANGKTVSIRPATEQEIIQFKARLYDHKKAMEAIRNG